jgi:ADP-ribosyl-[dinitrogen reductase] hydrolase
MALCLADTLLACGTVDIEDFNLRLQGWEASGENAAAGRRLDVDPGNGALLRMAPLAIFATLDVAVGEALAVRQSRATQAGVASLDACRLFAAQLADALNGADKAQATRQRVMALCPRVLFVSGGAWRDKPREEIAASGEVVDTLEAGLWAVSQTDKFRDAVRLAANLGGNASGAAAVAGQLAGALYGASGIPEKWLAALAWQERLEFAAADLFEARLPAP